MGLIALLGVLGLLVLGLAMLLRNRTPARASTAAILAVLLVVSLAFYTRGGLGSLTAVFLSPQIRTWSRFIVVIGLIGLVGIGLALTAVERRQGRIAALLLASVVLLVGVVDQTNPSVAPDIRQRSATRVESRRATCKRSRATSLGAAASSSSGPAVPRRATRGEDAELRPAGSLHRLDIRAEVELWRDEGTAAADWQRSLPATAQDGRLVDDLASAGFCALEVDTAGLTQPASPSTPSPSRWVSRWRAARTDNWSAFDLRGRRAGLVASLGEAAVTQRGDRVLHRLPGTS